MKKQSFPTLALFITLFCSVVFSCVLASAYTVGTVNVDMLNVRATASLDGEVLVSLKQGSQIALIERTGDWYKVNIGIFGFVHADYVNDPSDNDYAVSEAPVQDVPTVSDKQRMIVETAKQYLGVRYVYGGTSPSGFDCSGLVQYVYRQCGYRLNRVAADQASHGYAVDKSALEPGDLVFFKRGSAAIHHVGIYVGDGQYIHAPYTGTVVKIQPLSSRSDYYCARRIVE